MLADNGERLVPGAAFALHCGCVAAATGCHFGCSVVTATHDETVTDVCMASVSAVRMLGLLQGELGLFVHGHGIEPHCDRVIHGLHVIHRRVVYLSPNADTRTAIPHSCIMNVA